MATISELRAALRGRRDDWSAAADRLEIIIDCLTNLGVAAEVTVDQAAGARCVEYCRRRAAGGRESKSAEIELDGIYSRARPIGRLGDLR